MCVPIQRVHRDTAGLLTHIGGSTREGIPWGLTIAEGVALREARMYEFFVEVPAGKKVSVLVKTSTAGKKFLTTSPDGVVANNLDKLPDMPNPLAGVEPPFPLNIPSLLTGSLLSITSIGYSGNHTLTPLAMAGPITQDRFPDSHPPVVGFFRPTSFWTQTPRWFHLEAIVPFPARYWVFENETVLEQIPGNDPARRHALEVAGKGWWTYDLVLTKPDGTFDPTKPTRLTEIRMVIRPGASAWAKKNIRFLLNVDTINPYCPLGGNGAGFRVLEPAAPEPPPPPATATMPSVVGQRLDKALMTLGGLGLKTLYVVGPTAMSADLNVDSQTPAVGTVLKLTDPVYLKTSLAVAQTGVKKVVVNNQSSRAAPMDLWLYDYGTGAWNKKATVAYQAQADINLTDGHNFMLAAVDPTMLNCHSGRPDESPCVYSSPLRNYAGDDSGLVVPWQIV